MIGAERKDPTVSRFGFHVVIRNEAGFWSSKSIQLVGQVRRIVKENYFFRLQSLSSVAFF